MGRGGAARPATWGAPPAPGQSQGWGAGGHPLCSESFIQLNGSDWQPRLETDRFCLPDPEKRAFGASVDRSDDFAENSRFFASLGKGRACGHTGRAFLPDRTGWSEVTPFGWNRVFRFAPVPTAPSLIFITHPPPRPPMPPARPQPQSLQSLPYKATAT